MTEFDPAVPEKTKPKTIEETIEYEVHERELKAETMEGDNMFSQHIDSVDPAIRLRMVELYREEAETLRSLDPSTTTSDIIHQIYLTYKNRREALFPPEYFES